MEQESSQFPLRPAHTDDLVQRLHDADANYSNALQTNRMQSLASAGLRHLSTSMIKSFKGAPHPDDIPELVALSAVATGSDYCNLVESLENAAGADETVPNLNYLRGLRLAVRGGQCIAAKPRLGPMFKKLLDKLNAAGHSADRKSQYVLVCTLGAVLDAIHDTKVEGIDRETIHSPLYDTLKKLADDESLRLAQAALYALQGLVRTPDNESTYEKLGRIGWKVVVGVAKVAGGVAKMDPSQLLESLPDLAKIPELVGALYAALLETRTIYSDSKEAIRELPWLKYRRWYDSLRTTDILIKSAIAWAEGPGGSPEKGSLWFRFLTQFLDKFVETDQAGNRKWNKSDKHFWCGVCAQLEQASLTASKSSTRTKMAQVVGDILLPMAQDPRSSGRFGEWVRALCSTLEREEWRDSIPSPTGRQAARSRLFGLPLGSKRTRHYDTTSADVRALQLQLPTVDPLASELLRRVWPTCEAAHRCFDDIALRHQYELPGQVVVERLGGRPLPWEHCYVNLALVEDDASLLSRLGLAEPPLGSRVELKDVFNPRPRNNRQEEIIRVLIRGQAGVGKTTVCKKIVHEVVSRSLWADRFERILWIPLRDVKARGERCDRKGLLKDLFFDWDGLHPAGFGDVDADLYAQTMSNKLNDPKTLVILDGLDEVADLIGSRDFKLLNRLVVERRQPTIITSRPNGVSQTIRDSAHLVLDAVGFYRRQVESYVRAVAGSKAQDIMDFIKYHGPVQELTRIPIQLDAFCNSWMPPGDAPGTNGISQHVAPATMTSLYQAVELDLLRRDAFRLKKAESEADAQRLTYEELDKNGRLGSHVRLLQALAFTGLSPREIVEEFDQAYRRRAVQDVEDVDDNETASKEVLMTSLPFLRTSQTTSKFTSGTCHFLHLTFQEYFAARYFVRCWVKGDSIQYRTPAGELFKLDPEAFLRKSKYQRRYDIMWRFVTGLLYEQDPHQGDRFLESLEAQPRDLLGFTHGRLLMRCLADTAPYSTKLLQELRAASNRRLLHLEWLCVTVGHASTLTAETECPDDIPEQLLRHKDPQVRTRLLDGLQRRPRIPPNTVKLLAGWLATGQPESQQERRLKTFRCIRWRGDCHDYDQLYAAVLDELNGELGGGAVARQVRLCAIQIVQTFPVQCNMAEEVYAALCRNLKLGDDQLGAAVIEAFHVSERDDSTLPVGLLNLLVGQFDTKNDLDRLQPGRRCATAGLSDVGLVAFHALALRPTLPGSILDKVESFLQHCHLNDLDKILNRLYRRDAQRLPRHIINAIASLLSDASLLTHISIVWKIYRHGDLSPDAVKPLTALLDEEDSALVTAAVDSLSTQENLDPAILLTLADHVGHINPEIAMATGMALSNRTALPDRITARLASRLTDARVYVRMAAATALSSQAELPPDVVGHLADCLGECQPMKPGGLVTPAAALQKQPAELLRALRMARRHLQDGDADRRATATLVLKAWALLPDTPLDILDDLLRQACSDKEDLEVRVLAVEALGSRTLPLDTTTSLIRLLQSLNGEPGLLWSAITHTLVMRQGRLSDESFRILDGMLRADDNAHVLYATLEVLEHRKDLPDYLVQTVVDMIVAEDDGQAAPAPGLDKQQLAAFVARSQTGLQGDVLITLVRRLLARLADSGQSKGSLATAAEILFEKIHIPDEAFAFDTANGRTVLFVGKATVRDPRFYRELARCQPLLWTRLYRDWLRRSFREHLSCYFDDDVNGKSGLHVDMPEGHMVVPLHGHRLVGSVQRADIVRAFQEARKQLKVHECLWVMPLSWPDRYPIAKRLGLGLALEQLYLFLTLIIRYAISRSLLGMG